MNFTDQVYDNNPVLQRFFGDPAKSVTVNQAPMKPAASYRSFVEWLKANQPEVYNGIAYSRPDLVTPDMLFETGGFLGDAEQSAESAVDAQSILDKSLDTLQKLLPSYYQYQSQRQLIDLNIERAKQGLAPVDSSLVGPTLKVGMSSDMQRIAVIGLLGFFGLGALSLLTRNRRR